MQRGLPVVAGEAGAAGVRSWAGFAPTSSPAPVAGPRGATDVPVPHVVAWNLTRRCNLACAHCYIAAGAWHGGADELSTPDCRRIIDQILASSPAPMLILSGGEPLLRDDLEELASAATAGGATVVVGTNGTRLTDERIASLMAAGVQGVAISVDSLDPAYHDRFRHGTGALAETLAAIERLREHGLDFIIQTTLTRGNRDELDRLAAWSAGRGAVSFNLYFLVPTGRGDRMRGLSPAENDAVLRDLTRLQREYRGVMLVRSKCQPQIMRHVHEADPESPLLNYETRCPCGVHYCRITPEGKLTPCPYLPLEAGDLRVQTFEEIWRASPVLQRIRAGGLGGKCGRCEYREICGGCRARAFADSGDLMGPDESCAYEPDRPRAPVARRRTVTYGTPSSPGLSWHPAARARLERIPGFVRGVVTDRVEQYARERGIDEVTVELMSEIRRALPIDFSKRLPSFARAAAPAPPAGSTAHDDGDVGAAARVRESPAERDRGGA